MSISTSTRLADGCHISAVYQHMMIIAPRMYIIVSARDSALTYTKGVSYVHLMHIEATTSSAAPVGGFIDRYMQARVQHMPQPIGEARPT